MKRQFLIVYLKNKDVPKPVRKEYLKILGLNEHASDEQIKKAWKKKALQFHPDKNPSKNAQSEFIKICGAYEKLSTGAFEQLEESSGYPNQEVYKKYNQNLTPEEVEIRLQKAREYAKYKAIYEENIHAISYSQLKNSFMYKFSNIVGIVSLTVGSILLFDYAILEPKIEKAVILNHTYNVNNVSYSVYSLDYLLPPNEREFEISVALNNNNYKALGFNSFVNLYKSQLLHEYISFSHEEDSYNNSMNNRYSIYIAIWVFIALFFLPIINFVARGPNTLYLVFMHVNAFLPIFTLIGLLVGLA